MPALRASGKRGISEAALSYRGDFSYNPKPAAPLTDETDREIDVTPDDKPADERSAPTTGERQMDDMTLAKLEEMLMSRDEPTTLALAWIMRRLELLHEEIEELRFQLNTIEAKINTMHQSKFGT